MAAVPTGMNTGVSTLPWGVCKVDLRAARVILLVSNRKDIHGDSKVEKLLTDSSLPEACHPEPARWKRAGEGPYVGLLRL